ncbi:MAG TPA: hypothetical protein VFX59_25120 [Polyangiales bacterium]|nr:hypothetical protein [Polyangiales bacterium]
MARARIEAANAGFAHAMRAGAWVATAITLVCARMIARFMKR